MAYIFIQLAVSKSNPYESPLEEFDDDGTGVRVAPQKNVKGLLSFRFEHAGHDVLSYMTATSFGVVEVDGEVVFREFSIAIQDLFEVEIAGDVFVFHCWPTILPLRQVADVIINGQGRYLDVFRGQQYRLMIFLVVTIGIPAILVPLAGFLASSLAQPAGPIAFMLD